MGQIRSPQHPLSLLQYPSGLIFELRSRKPEAGDWKPANRQVSVESAGMVAQGADRSNEEVLERILRPATPAGAQRDETMAMVRVAENDLPVLAALKVFSQFLPAEIDPELSEYYRLALLGVGVGFKERNLSPDDEAHVEIIPALLKDIRIVFMRLKELKAEYDPEDFRFQAYDYGIHKAYYLDWCLYLSKTLY